MKLNGEDAELLVDEAFIEKERKDIEDTFTYVLPKKGRVILKRDRADFDKQITRFKQIVMKYRDALKSCVELELEGFRQQMVDEFAERWNANPPSFLKRRSGGNDPDRIKDAILDRADELFKRIVDFAPPEVDVNYKGVVIEDIEDAEFRARALAKIQDVPDFTGAPDTIRTCDLCLRRAALALFWSGATTIH